MATPRMLQTKIGFIGNYLCDQGGVVGGHAEPELIRPMGPWQDFELLDGSLIVAEKYNEP